MKKIVELLRLRRSWTVIGLILGTLGYANLVPVTSAIGDAVASPPSVEVTQ